MTSSISFNPATNGVFSPPPPHNEPVLEYTPGSPMKGYLKLALEEMANREADVPMRIGGESVRSSAIL